MIKAVLFDFDGTLADSSSGIFHTALHTVRKLGIDKEYSNEDNAVSVTDLSGKSLGTHDMQAPVTNGLAPGVYILGKKGENAKKVIIR